MQRLTQICSDGLHEVARIERIDPVVVHRDGGLKVVHLVVPRRGDEHDIPRFLHKLNACQICINTGPIEKNTRLERSEKPD